MSDETLRNLLGKDFVAYLAWEGQEVVDSVPGENLDGDWLQQVAPLVHLPDVIVRKLAESAETQSA